MLAYKNVFSTSKNIKRKHSNIYLYFPKLLESNQNQCNTINSSLDLDVAHHVSYRNKVKYWQLNIDCQWTKVVDNIKRGTMLLGWDLRWKDINQMIINQTDFSKKWFFSNTLANNVMDNNNLLFILFSVNVSFWLNEILMLLLCCLSIIFSLKWVLQNYVHLDIPYILKKTPLIFNSNNNMIITYVVN